MLGWMETALPIVDDPKTEQIGRCRQGDGGTFQGVRRPRTNGAIERTTHKIVPIDREHVEGGTGVPVQCLDTADLDTIRVVEYELIAVSAAGPTGGPTGPATLFFLLVLLWW